MASLSSSVPAIQFTPAGLVIPAESDILAGVAADIDAAFGGGLNPALETPQGQLASSQTAVIAAKNTEVANIVNQVDPQYATDKFQDAIGRIYFQRRKGATATVVPVIFGGVPGTVIAAGTLAQDASGNTYRLTNQVTIENVGTVAGEMQNVDVGPIPCPAGTLIKVYQGVNGWDTITNPNDGAIGNLTESRADFEYRRKNSVALNGHGSAESIYAAVFDLPNVLDVYVAQNYTDAVVTVGATSYPLAKHSVYVAAVGGDSAEIAAAIWRKKDLGCNMNGNTSITITDESGYNYPQPSYVVKFERPPSVPILFAVEIVNDPLLPTDIVARIKDAIIARFNGQDGTSRERIGATVFATRYYGAIANAYAGATPISILIGLSTPTLSQVPIGVDQTPSISASNISVSLV